MSPLHAGANAAVTTPAITGADHPALPTTSRSATLARTTAAKPLMALALILASALAPESVRAVPALGERVELAAQSLDGRRVGLEDSDGRRTVLLLWTPESLASRKSLGEIQRFADSLDADKVVLLTVSLSGSPASLRKFMAARQVNFPVALRRDDNLGRIDEDRLPIALVIGADGRLLRQRAGLINLRTLLELLEPSER